MTYSATQLGKLSGQIIMEAQKEPVKIQRNGKECVAVISIQDLELLEESRKAQKLRESIKDGFSQIESGEYTTRTAKEILAQVMKDRGSEKRA